MSKFASVLCASLFVFALSAGCSKDKKEDTTPTTTTEPAPEGGEAVEGGENPCGAENPCGEGTGEETPPEGGEGTGDDM